MQSTTAGVLCPKGKATLGQIREGASEVVGHRKTVRKASRGGEAERREGGGSREVRRGEWIYWPGVKPDERQSRI